MMTNPLPFGGPKPQRMSRRPPPAPTKAHGVVMLNGGAIVIKFSAPNSEYIKAVKTIRGWVWNPDKFWWQVHIGHVRQVRDLAHHFGWTMSPQFAALPDVSVDQVPVIISAEGEQLIADGPYREDVWEVMGQADCRFHERTGRWFIPAENALDVILDLQAIASIRFVGENELLAMIEQSQKMLRLSRALEPSPDFVLTDRVARQLHGFQLAGVEYLTMSRRCFGWATMGAGKTTVALAAIEQLEAYPCVVIPPAGIKTNWVDEVRAVVPHRKAVICEGEIASPLARYAERGHKLADIIIVNYDILGKVDNQRSWAAQLVKLGVDGLIFDEGHRLIGRKTIRTIAANAISDSMEADAPRFLLTGTPVRNKRDDVHPQLEAIGRGGEFGTKKQLRDDQKLSRRLRTVCAWRPDPKEVLVKLGKLAPDGSMEPIQQIVHIDGDPAIMAEYRFAEANLLDYLKQKAREKAARLGLDPNAAEVEAEMNVEAAGSLMAVNTLSAIATRAKMAAAVEWMQDFLAGGEKLLAFAINRDMMDAIALGTIPQINGDVGHKERTALVNRFQDKSNPADLQALVLQMTAAGEGLTLTEAWHAMFAQIDWVPGAHDQCAARAAWRMNDPHPVVEHYLICRGTIDEDRFEVLAEKRIIAKSVIDGDKILAESTFKDVMARIIKRAIG